MKQYLIVLDLDGTLLSDWQTISETTKNYLKDLSKQGHKVVIATGRPFRSSERFYDDICRLETLFGNDLSAWKYF